MEDKYKYGAIVFSKEFPMRKMIVRRCEDAVYYCKVLEDLAHDEVAFSEEELDRDVYRNPYA
jgi:hypothetical protein